MDWLANNRAAVMAVLFVLFVVWEALGPVAKRTLAFRRRWLINYSLYLLASGISVALHALPVLWGAQWASVSEYGLFNVIGTPLWLQGIVALLAFDLVQYINHRLMHYFDFLWRFHSLHHSDQDVDLTTGFRFHPIEAALSLSFHIVVVVFLGLSPAVVLFYWLFVVFSNYFGHANIRIPESTDRFLQQLFITPSLHRLHHSNNPLDEGNSYNFGSLLTIWDRLMQTYKPAGTLDEQSRRTFGIESRQA